MAREESQKNQNGAENTNRENRCIASLAVWYFGGAQSSTFWDGNSLQDRMEPKRNLSLAAYLSARKTYLLKKKRYLQTQEHTILLSRERVNKGRKRMNSLPLSPSLRDFAGKTAD